MVQNKNDLSNIMEGSKLYVNAQITLHLIQLLKSYRHSQEELFNIFSFAETIKQRKVKLYPQLKKEVNELLYLKHQIDKEKIAFEDTKVIFYVINSILLSFTENKAHR